MPESDKKKAKKTVVNSVLMWLGATLGVLLILAALAGGGFFAYTRMYSDKIYPGVKMLGVRLDGLTKDEAKQKMDKEVDTALDKGLSFALDGEQSTIHISSDNDLPDLILYDTDKAVDQAYSIGRQNAAVKIFTEVMAARIRTTNVPVDIQVDEQRIKAALEQQFASKLPVPKDATFSIETKGKEPAIKVIQEKEGRALDYTGIMEKVRQQAAALSFQTINLKSIKTSPQRRSSDLQPLIEQVEAVLARPQLVFTYEDTKYKIPTSTLAGWIVSDPSNNSVTLDKVAFASSIRAMAKGVEAENKNGSIEVKDGKIASFTAATVGRKINIDKTLDPVLTSWPPSSTFPLIVDEERGEITGGDIEQFGIKELIGVGKSNFRGSPSNRIKNIRKAVYERVNGTLIAPGEEFSMLKTLGSVDGAHGWLPELVIKGNKTMPEFGGGLCQIGTTMFRGAIDSGLPVTERRNHSYRVSYYEPAGTDATIYEPAPDFKFMNDTGKYILVNAYITGTEISFEFWGTKDGRKVETTKPRIYNIVAPPPTKLTETLDLAPGQKKCSESAHAGADAEFSTAVEYADGRKREETFSSHYRPWGAVCLIGVEKLSEPADTTASESNP